MSVFVKTGSFLARTGLGTQAVIGLGFAPKGLLIWTQQSPITGGSSGLQPFRYALRGFSDGATSFGTSAAENNGGSTITCSSSGNTPIINGISNAHIPEIQASVVSFDADGFTLNWLTNLFGAGAVFLY